MKQLTIETPYHVGQVHIYLAEIDGDLVLFDTGPPLDSAKQLLRDNIDFDRLRYVFVTHGHIDHYGLATFLKQESDAQIILPRHAIRQLTNINDYNRQLIDVFTSLGFPSKPISMLLDRFAEASKMAALPDGCLVAEDAADILNQLGIALLSCPWHSQSDLVYLFQNYALVGDVALRGLFPVPILDVDFASSGNRRFDNYSAFCTSIDRLKQLKDTTFLPAHNRYLDDLDGWICFAVSKIVNRAAKLLAHYLAGKSIYQTVMELFVAPSIDPLKTFLKTSEVVFMFDFLQAPERLQQVMQKHNLYGLVENCFHKINLDN